jgi:hypothetical protein
MHVYVSPENNLKNQSNTIISQNIKSSNKPNENV